MRFKSLLIAVLLSFSSLAYAGNIQVTWSSGSDPVGWNLYFNHLQTPDAFQYVGSIAGSERSATFHNISSTGLYQVGVTRVEYVNDNGVNRRIEGPMQLLTVLDGQFLSSPSGISFTSSSFDPNGS